MAAIAVASATASFARVGSLREGDAEDRSPSPEPSAMAGHAEGEILLAATKLARALALRGFPVFRGDAETEPVSDVHATFRANVSLAHSLGDVAANVEGRFTAKQQRAALKTVRQLAAAHRRGGGDDHQIVAMETYVVGGTATYLGDALPRELYGDVRGSEPATSLSSIPYDPRLTAADVGKALRLATAAAEVLGDVPPPLHTRARAGLVGGTRRARRVSRRGGRERILGRRVRRPRRRAPLVGARRLRLEAGPRPGTARSARGAERAERAERAVERAVEGDAEGAFYARPRGEGGGYGGEAIETGTGGAGGGAGGDDASTRIDRARRDAVAAPVCATRLGTRQLADGVSGRRARTGRRTDRPSGEARSARFGTIRHSSYVLSYYGFALRESRSTLRLSYASSLRAFSNPRSLDRMRSRSTPLRQL